MSVRSYFLSSNESIQQKINNANEYDTVFIPDGIYTEHITIDKPLTLIGEKKTIIDGLYRGRILEIHSDNVIIKNIQFCNTGGENDDSGVYVDGDNISLQNCVFYQSRIGINLQKTSSVDIISCFFFKLGTAIAIHDSNQIQLMTCSVAHSAIGIFLKNSSSIISDQSKLDTNGISIYVLKSHHVDIMNNSVKDNSDNHGGIFIDQSSSINIVNSSINHNGIGINIENSRHVLLQYCHITNNTHFGILLREESKEILIRDCTINNNFRYGIYCNKKSKAIIIKNNLENNFIYALFSVKPVHTLKHNWWDSSSGPSISPMNRQNRISLNNYILHYNNWDNVAYSHDEKMFNHSEFYNDLDIQSPDITSFITGTDSDEDGAADWWEKKWGYSSNLSEPHHFLDPDDDGLTNIEECYTDSLGSNPFRKDIFLEIDWIESNDSLHSNKPSIYLLQRIQHTFSTQNIALHIDYGNLGQGGEIPYQTSTDFMNMVDMYWNHFLCNDPLNPRKGLFHYAIISDECADVSYPFIGWDQFDSIAISADVAKQINPQYPRQMIIAGGILHQLGSTLGLLVETYDGNDNLQTGNIGSIDWLIYRDYKSSMNYLYKYRVLTFSDGSHGKGDFNDWNQLNLSFFKNTSFTMKQ